MSVSLREQRCPKCDSELRQQSDGSTVSVDIAHHGETVLQAISKLDEILLDLENESRSYLRLIVGSGLIRDEVNYHLSGRRRDFLSFGQDGRNTGAILIHLK